MPFSIQQSSEVIVRVDLARLCNRLGIRVGAEVGTDLGVFARQFLDQWHGDMLLCIDPYEPYVQMPYDRMGDLLTAIVALQPHHGRVKIIREQSPRCAIERRLPDWYVIGFVYIDGNHELEPVRADIEAWWDVLDDGGILAGHDWDHMPGVQQAVTEFARRHDLAVELTHDKPTSWYIRKPRNT